MIDVFSLKNKVALITGSSGHLGSELAFGLAKAGAHVIINGRNIDKLHLLQSKLNKENLESTIACFDVCDTNNTKQILLTLLSQIGKLDIIINNAYSGKPGNINSSHPADFISAFEITSLAAFELYKITEKYLIESGKKHNSGASIINICSMYGNVSPNPSIYHDSGFNNPPYYGVAKAGLLQLTKYMACHLAKDNIRVNSISPGPFPANPEEINKKTPDFFNALIDKVPLKRIGRPDELIGAALFLSSRASSFVTGANIPVDGGWTAW